MSRGENVGIAAGCLMYIIWGLLVLGFWGAVIYIALHFIGKYW